jgi:hypothetical protein
MRPGMGVLIDLSAFDQMAGLQRANVPILDVFSDAGSFWHVLLGGLVGLIPGGLYEGAAGLAFSGYEVSKLAAGESAQRVAGSLVEFSIGLLLAALIRRYA